MKAIGKMMRCQATVYTLLLMVMYIYTGNFADDWMNGQGTLTRPSGDNYSGNWVDGEYQG